MLFLSVICHAAELPFTAGRFWGVFREAVLSNDEEKIVSMTRLPLEVHGVSDSTPVRFYGRREVPRIFNKILMQPEYLVADGKIVSKTLLGLIFEKKVVTRNDLTLPDHFRFYQLEFEKINGRWFWIRAYLEAEGSLF